MNEPAKPEIATERTRLSIPFDDNQRAIRAAGKLKTGENALEFDKEEKVWYARAGANLTRLKEWIYDPASAASAQPSLDPRDEFANFLESKGAILDGLPVMDGKKHYVDIEGHDTGSRKGVYAGFLDGRPAGWFRNYKGDQELERWTATGDAPADPVALAQMRAESAAKREERQKAATEGFNTRASELMEEFRSLPAATGQEQYLLSKGVGADGGIKSDSHGNVVIPLINADGEFRTLERIWPDGNKVLATGGQAWGSFYVVGGQLRDGDDIYYAEGYSTAKSVSEATGKAVVMTVNAGNMVEVAGHLHERFPGSTHYFMADNDVYKEVNAGLNKATEAAELTNGHVIVPAFSQPREGLTDFNDLHSTEGLAAVKGQIESAIQQLNKVESMPSIQPDTLNSVPAESATATEINQVAETEQAPTAAAASQTTEQGQAPAETPVPDVTPTTAEPAALTGGQPAAQPASESPADTASAAPAQTSPGNGSESPGVALNEQSNPAGVVSEQTPQVAIQSVSEQPPAPDYADYYSHYAAEEDDRGEPYPDASLPPAALQAADSVMPGERSVAEHATAESETAKPARVVAEENAGAETVNLKKAKASDAAEPNGFTWSADDNVTTPPKERIDLDALMQRITYRAEKDHVAYMLEGKDAFYDYGNQLRMANTDAGNDDAMVLAALQTAMAQHKRGIEITGSAEFKERVLVLMADYKMDAKLSDPQQRARYQELQKQQTETDSTPAARTTAATGATSARQGEDAQNTPAASSVSQNGMNIASENSPLRPKDEATADSGWLSGVIVAHGRDNYEHDKSNAMNYFVKVQNERGEKTVWGKDLERAIHDAGVDTGRLVNLRTVGDKDVQVNVPVRDENDKVIRWEKADVKRMEWEVKAAYPQKTQANPEALKPSDLVAYDAVTFNQVRDKIQAMKIDLSHERLPKQDVYWFQPNGKPAPADMQKPKDYTIAENSKQLGTPLLASPAGKNSSPEYILFESKKGFMQGVIRDQETGQYHSVIGKINTKYKDGERKDYMTLSAVNANSANGMVWHGYGNANGKGNGIVYQNVMNKENTQHHLQPVSDDVKNKSEMKRILNVGNAAKQTDDERGTQQHAPSTKSAPKP